MRLDTFTKNNIILFCASSIGSFFNLVYQVMMLRLLSKEAFTSLNSLVSLLVIISVPSVAFSTMVTKHISIHNARKEYESLKTVWQRLAGHALLFSAALFAIIFLLKTPLADFLHLNSSTGIVLLGAIFFCGGLASVVTGGLQGLEKFKWLAVFTVIAGLCKLLFSIALVKSIPDALTAALLGFLLPLFIGVVISIWPIRFLLRGIGNDTIEIKPLYKYILPVLAVNLSFALLTNIDMILVKHFFIYESQDYAVAQMIGKIILSIAGVIYMVMFARIAHLHAVSQSSRDVLKRSLLFTFYLSSLAALWYNIFPHFTFSLIAGKVNSQVILLARVFSISMLFFALSNVLFYYQLSIEQYGFITPLIALGLLEAAAICLFPNTPLFVAAITLLCAAALFFLNLRSAFRHAR